MTDDADCIFCKIIRGEIPSFNVFEDDATFAFKDINPANDGHVLFIPTEHTWDVHAILATMITARKVASAVERTLNPDGVNLLQCNGPDAAQSVFHFHMHVLPRREGDELKLNWVPKSGDMDAIEALSVKMRHNIE